MCNIQVVQGIEKEGRIHKNIFVENIDLSNLTKEQARKKINEILDENNELSLIYKNNKYTIKLNELGITYNVDEVVNESYNIGRNNTIVNNLKEKFKLDMGNKKTIKLNYSYKEEELNNYINEIDKKLYISPINATIKIESGKIITTKEEYGQKIDKEKLKKEILDKADNIYAYSVEIPIQVAEPKYKIEQLSKIDTILGTYETHFNPKVINRVNNIQIAANATSNILVNTEEEFSFNRFILNSNSVKNMKEAPVIIKGKLEKGLGGGICQVSSTMYNAALYAGMEITNIKNHTIPSAYISKGRDATISLGNIDFRFKNKFNTPILIYNEVFENRIVSTIYGNKEDKKDIEIVTEVIETLPNKVVEKHSEDLYKGEKFVEQDGRVGYKVNTFRVYKSENNITKEFVYESFYPPMDKVIVYGIKSKDIKSAPKIEDKNIKTEFA